MTAITSPYMDNIRFARLCNICRNCGELFYDEEVIETQERLYEALQVSHSNGNISMHTCADGQNYIADVIGWSGFE